MISANIWKSELVSQTSKKTNLDWVPHATVKNKPAVPVRLLTATLHCLENQYRFPVSEIFA